VLCKKVDPTTYASARKDALLDTFKVPDMFTSLLKDALLDTFKDPYIFTSLYV
jgi:hypothetical protein